MTVFLPYILTSRLDSFSNYEGLQSLITNKTVIYFFAHLFKILFHVITSKSVYISLIIFADFLNEL